MELENDRMNKKERMVRNDIILEMGSNNDRSGLSKLKKIDWQGKKKRKKNDRQETRDRRTGIPEICFNVTMSIGP